MEAQAITPNPFTIFSSDKWKVFVFPLLMMKQTEVIRFQMD
jgi:hypothetical protein